MMQDQTRRAPERSPNVDPAALVRLVELRNRIGYVYGSENISMLLYALIRRERPVNIVELGSGLGVSTFWMAQAVKENGSGKIWTLDDGSHWVEQHLDKTLDELYAVEPFDRLAGQAQDFAGFFNGMIDVLGYRQEVSFLNMRVDLKREEDFTPARYPFLAQPIDLVFMDIDRKPEGILDQLYFLLPHIGPSASFFIDSASTSLTSYLFLEKLVEQMNSSKIPRHFLLGKSPERRQALMDAVMTRRFSLMHLVERMNRPQNSTAWLKVEPNDYMPHPKTAMVWV